MKVAITGGSGLLGRMFLETYGDQYQCIVLGRGDTFTPPNQSNLKFAYRQTDYSAESLLTGLSGADCVIHLAAQKVTREDSFADYVQSNLLVSSYVFEACRQLNIDNIVFTSSRLVYSDANRLPWSEDDDPKPVNFYGISKLCSEKLAYYYNENHQMNIKSLRLAQVVGTEVDVNDRFIVTKFIWNAAHKKPLTVHSGSTGRREYIYVKDAVAALNCAIHSRDVNGVFNIGAGKNISSKELAILVNKIFGNDGNVKIVDSPKRDKAEVLLDINKAQKYLGYEPQWTLESTITDIKKYL